MLLTARYVLPVSTPHIEHGAILVRGDSIVEIGEADDLLAAHPEEEVLDFGLSALIPGFVDLHTHLEYSAMRGLVDDVPYSQWKLQLMQLEQRLDEADWNDAAQLGAMEALRSGITTVVDITESGASARAAASAGLRGVVFREVATMDKARIPDVIARAKDDIQTWKQLSDAGLLGVGIAPHAPYSCHPELFGAAASLAADLSLPAATHLAGSRDEYDFVKYGSSRLAFEFRDMAAGADIGWLPTGVSPVQYVRQWGLFDLPDVLAVHCTQVDTADIEVLADSDVAIAYCPRCNAKLGMGIAPLSEFLVRGMRVGIGTDSPASNNTMDVFEEMRIGLLLQRSISGHEKFYTAQQFVKLATLDAARAMRLDGVVGSLEPGKKADIVAVDISHTHQLPTQNPYGALVHTANQENVTFTMVAGRTLYADGEWLTLDAERIRLRAEEMRVKLRA